MLNIYIKNDLTHRNGFQCLPCVESMYEVMNWPMEHIEFCIVLTNHLVIQLVCQDETL